MSGRQQDSGRRIHLLVILPVLAGQVLLSCVAAHRHQSQTPDALLRTFLAQPTPSSYAAQLKLWMKADGKGSGKSEIEAFRNPQGYYSFSAKDLWGREALTAIIRPDSMLVYYPQEKQFIRASILKFSKSEYWRWYISPRNLLELVDGNWVTDLKEVAFLGDRTNLVEYQARKGNFQVNFRLSKSDGILRELILLDSTGDTVWVRYIGTREYKGYLRPKRLELKLSGSASSIKIGISEEQFDLELPDTYFSIDLPQTAQRIPLD